jgi:CubicO group peptidase (beta-lactamase class C family)
MTKRYLIMGFSLAVSLTVLGVSLYWTGNERRPTPIAYLYISPAWTDSILNELNPAEKAGQLLLVRLPAQESVDSLLHRTDSLPAGGYLFEQSSFLHQLQTTQQLRAQTRLPLIMGMEHSRQGLEFPDPLALASVVEEEQITFFGEGLAEQAQALGLQLLITPSLDCASYSEELLANTARLFPPLAFRRLLSGMRVQCPGQAGFPDTSELFLQNLSESGLNALVYRSEGEGDAARIRDLRRSFKGLILVEVADSLSRYPQELARLLKNGADAFIVQDSARRFHQELTHLASQEKFSIRPQLRRLLLAKDWSKPRAELALDSLKYTHFNRKFQEAALTLLKDEDRALPLDDVANKRPLLLTLGEPLARFEAFMRYYAPLRSEPLSLSDSAGLPPLPARRYRDFDPIILALNHARVDADRDTAFLASLEKLRQQTRVIILNVGSPDQLTAFQAYPTLIQAYDSHPSVQDLPAQAIWGGIPFRGRFPVDWENGLKAGQGLTTSKVRLGYDLPEAVGMDSDMLSEIDSVVIYGIRKRAMPGCQVLVAKNGRVVYSRAFGHHTYSRKQPVKTSDLYDLASLTKVAATTLAAMKMYEQGRLRLDAPLSQYFEDTFIETDRFSSEDAVLKDTLSLEAYQDSLQVWGLDSLPQFADSLIPEGVPLQLNQWVSRVGDTAVATFQRASLSLSFTSNIFLVPIRDLLTHRSGLQAAMPILNFLNYRKDSLGRYDRYFARQKSETHSIEVARNFYLGNVYRDSLWEAVKRLKRYNRRVYRYSDVNMVLLQWAMDSLNQMPLDQYLKAAFYRDLGLQHLGFRPLEWADRKQIVPSSLDLSWRGQLLRGHVHDEVAALQGGVSGNAGLFANSNDLAILSQMLLNKGTYGGKKFLDPATVELFTQQREGYRGLGFDKAPVNGSFIGSRYASPATFGHTGFTGTCFWVDPEHDLIFIFLSNRVYPSRNNWRLNTFKIRQRIHDAMYRSIKGQREIS